VSSGGLNAAIVIKPRVKKKRGKAMRKGERGGVMRHEIPVVRRILATKTKKEGSNSGVGSQEKGIGKSI